MADHQNPPAAKTKAAGLLKPIEAAEYLAVSVRQLRDLTLWGKILYVNVGLGEREVRRYHVADLEAFIADRKHQSVKFDLRPPKVTLYPNRSDILARLDAISFKQKGATRGRKRGPEKA